jgi:thiosulfate/3-mercaptopyruvate sulfurtransferase
LDNRNYLFLGVWKWEIADKFALKIYVQEDQLYLGSLEFCCTCPDYANFDEWLAKSSKICDSAGNIKPASDNTANGNKANTIEEPRGYPNPEIITYATMQYSGSVIVDVREKKDYEKGHLPGARNLDWTTTQRDEILDPSLMQNALRKIGVNNSDLIMLYGGKNDEASYIFWAMSYIGHKNLTKLNGGLEDAVSNGNALTKSAQKNSESNYTIHIVQSLLVNESRLDRSHDKSGIQILDARDFSEYGKAKLTSAALPLDAKKLYLDNFKIKDQKTLDDLLGRRLEKNKIQIVYGTPDAYSLFYALELMGYNSTLIEGSWWKDTNWVVSIVK